VVLFGELLPQAADTFHVTPTEGMGPGVRRDDERGTFPAIGGIWRRGGTLAFLASGAYILARFGGGFGCRFSGADQVLH